MPKFVWDLDPVLVQLGPFPLRYYSLLFVGVFMGGFSFLRWQIVRGGGKEEDASDFIVYGVIGVLAGSRLGHVLFYDLDKALRDPLWVLEIWTGGLASHGAVIGLMFAMWLFCRRKRVPWLEGSDRFAFSAALGATLVRVGNFFNSEIVGRVVPGQTWGTKFPRCEYDRGKDLADVPYRYPSQLFEIALGVAVLGALYVIDRAAGKEKRSRGLLIFSFFALYFTGRFFVEYIKEFQAFAEKALVGQDTNALTMGQFLSIPGALLGYFGVAWSLRAKLPVGWPNPDLEKKAKKAKKAAKKKTKKIAPVVDDEDDDDGEIDSKHDPDVDEALEEQAEEKRARTGGGKDASKDGSDGDDAPDSADDEEPESERKR